jgi:hypothetical protein
MDWLELIDWKTILPGIGIAIGALGFHWTVLPENSV